MEPSEDEVTVGEVLAEADVSAEAAQVVIEVAEDAQVLESPVAELPVDVWGKILNALPKDDSAALMNALLKLPAFDEVMKSPDFTQAVRDSGTLTETTEEGRWKTDRHVYTQHDLDEALAVQANPATLHVHVSPRADQQAALTSALAADSLANVTLHDGVTLDTVNGGKVEVLQGATVTSVTDGVVTVDSGATVTVGEGVELIVDEFLEDDTFRNMHVRTADGGLVIKGIRVVGAFTVLDPQGHQLYPPPR